MSRLTKYAGVATLVAVVAALGISSAAFAHAPLTTSVAPAARPAHGGGFGGRGPCGETGLEAAAGVLGMTADELSTQLWGGKRLADLADEAGVELQAVRDAVTAACQDATKAAIEQAVEDGSLTREHADWLLEGLAKGYWGGGMHGFGPRGFGRGGFPGGGFHGFGGGFPGGPGFRGFGFPNSNSVTPDSSGL